MQLATGAYCLAIAHLINHPRDAQGAIAAATAWLQQGLAAALQQVGRPAALVARMRQAPLAALLSRHACSWHAMQHNIYAAVCMVQSSSREAAAADKNLLCHPDMTSHTLQGPLPGSNHSSASGSSSAGSSSAGSSASREHDDAPADGAAPCSKAAAAWGTVLGWLGEAQQEGPGPEVQHAAGYVKWGFVHAFRWVDGA